MEPLEIAIPLTLGFAVSLALTVPAGALARRLGAVDQLSERGVNRQADMPLWGGLAVGVAVAVAVATWDLVTGGDTAAADAVCLALGGGLLLAMGLWDDRFGLSAWPKLSVQILAAALAVWSGHEIARLTDPFTLQVVDLPRWAVWPATLLWIVGITNAMNLLDGLDGLASGVGAIIGITLTLIAYQAGEPFGVVLGLALVGALLGFLPHNFSPARIFLGDTGSTLIGYVLAIVALEGYRRVSLITFVVPLLALAIPILDTLLSIVRRVRMRAPILAADRMHMHHRLLDAEGSTTGAVLQFYLLTAAFCLIALSFTQLQGLSAAVFLAAVIALTLRLLWNLGSFRVSEDEGEPDDSSEGSS